MAAGGGHLCPWEVYVFVNGIYKKDRVTSGLNNNRGCVHTYFRQPGAPAASATRRVFEEACANFIAMIPLPATVAVAASSPPRSMALPPPLTAILAFDGAEYGEGYLSFAMGEKLLPREPPVPAEGWAYGSLAGGAVGWFPPSYAA